MTSLPTEPSERALGLVIDLDTCVGCQACVVACKEWNAGGFPAPLSDQDPYGLSPSGTFLNRVHGYEIEEEEDGCRTAYLPKSCLHCSDAACVTVCPTGASYKRAEDGIVLVEESKCIGCGLCAWACPYGARELDGLSGVMKKCTLCVDRIYNETLAPEAREPACVSACPTRARHFGDLKDPQSAVSRLVAARGGLDLMPEMGYRPTNKYLPSRPRRRTAAPETPQGVAAPETTPPPSRPGLFAWLDCLLAD